MSTGKKRFPRWMVMIILLLVFVLLGSIIDYCYHRNRIYSGVYFEENHLGGRTKKEACEMIEKHLEKMNYSKSTVNLTYQNDQISKTFNELGIEADVEAIIDEAYTSARGGLHFFRYLSRLKLVSKQLRLAPRFTIDTHKFGESLQDIEAVVRKVPQNAEFLLSADKKTVTIKPDVPGQALDIKATLKELQSHMTGLFSSYTSPLVVALTDAEISASYLEALRIEELLATCSTTFSSAIPNRVRNIRLSAGELDHIIILPDEEFSFNEVVGDSTIEKGYKPAPVIVNGELVEGIGGGVCQVSSTLYNTALRANLEIIERRNHSLYVSYLPPGLDATVAYGYIDLRFKNNHPFALWLRTFIEKDQLIINLYSTKIPGQDVKVFTTDLKKIPPPDKITETGELPKGTRRLVTAGKTGYEVSVWRVTTIDGEEIKREKVSKDHYKAVPAEYLIGTGEIPVSNTEE